MTSAPEKVEHQTIPASALLQARIAAVRRRYLAVKAGTGAGIAACVLIVLLADSMLLDWWLDLPRGMRALLLTIAAGATGYVLWRFMITPFRKQPDDDMVALAVERAFPQFRSRLISATQFPRPGVIDKGVDASLARLTIAETEAIAAPLDFTEVVHTSELKKSFIWAVVLAAAAIFLMIHGGEVSRDLLKRAFLSAAPVPRHTRVELLTPDHVAGRGDTVRIEAIAHGIVPKTGRLTLKSSGRRVQEFVMEKDREGRFSRTLENVQQTFTFLVELNDGKTKWHRIEVVPRPMVATLECEQIYPAYTKLPAAKRPLGDLALLAGSKLRLSATATKDLKSAFIHCVGVTNDIPLQLDSKNSRLLRGELTVPPRGLTGFSVEMIDTGSMTSRDSAVYRVDVIPDRAPKVRVEYPDRKEELVTRHAVQPVSFTADDDFRIARARMRYKVGDAESVEIRTVEFALPTNAVTSRFSGFSMTNRYEWQIREFQPPLAEGTRIEFWLGVEDYNDVTGPGLSSSEHQLLRVVSENEKRADLLNRAGDFLGTIGDVTGDQEKLNLKLGEIILEKKRQ